MRQCQEQLEHKSVPKVTFSRERQRRVLVLLLTGAPVLCQYGRCRHGSPTERERIRRIETGRYNLFRPKSEVKMDEAVGANFIKNPNLNARICFEKLYSPVLAQKPRVQGPPSTLYYFEF
jgi:hypothetical protein